MKKRTFGWVCLALSLFAVSPTGAQAQTVLDQIQPVIDGSAGAKVIIGGAGRQRLMQTLTIGVTGTWTGVYLPIGCSSRRLVLNVHPIAGGVVGPSIYTRTYTVGNIPEINGRFRLFPLGTALAVTAGQEYALILDNPTGSCGIAVGPVGDSYAGGDGYFEALPNPPGFIPFSSFPGARRDLPFQVVVRR